MPNKGLTGRSHKLGLSPSVFKSRSVDFINVIYIMIKGKGIVVIINKQKHKRKAESESKTPHSHIIGILEKGFVLKIYIFFIIRSCCCYSTHCTGSTNRFDKYDSS